MRVPISTIAADRRAYAAEAVAIAETETPNRLRRLARRLAERFQERTVTERHRDARELRRVWVKDLDDGMAELGARGPAALVHGMFDRLSQMSHAVKKDNARAARDAGSDGPPADERTVDQLRADLLADLLLTGTPAGHDTTDGLLGEIQARIEVSVPVMSLMGDDLHSSEPSLTGDDGGDSFRHETPPPALLDGTTPIDITTARRLAGPATGWDRRADASDLRRAARRRPLPAERAVAATSARAGSAVPVPRVRDRGAEVRSRPQSRGLDRRRDHRCEPRGVLPTTSHAQTPLPWHVEQRAGGVLEWTSPTGRSYVDRPPPQNTVTFTESAVPVPF